MHSGEVSSPVQEQPARCASFAALMVQRSPDDALRKRPREDALLEAERSHQRRRVEFLEEEMIRETMRCVEQERSNKLICLTRIWRGTKS